MYDFFNLCFPVSNLSSHYSWITETCFDPMCRLYEMWYSMDLERLVLVGECLAHDGPVQVDHIHLSLQCTL